jgi:FkbM family methyltransferase
MNNNQQDNKEMNIYKVGNNLMALSQKQVENLINKRDNYDIREREIVEELASGNVLDIGANIGYFTVIMAKLEKVKKVIAFEPDPTNYYNLLLNIGINLIPKGKVELYKHAITNNNGNTYLYKCNQNDGMHRIYQSKWCSHEHTNVSTVRIDDLDYITCFKIDFVKLDVEGSELGALRGMEQMLKRDHPTIMLEFHPPSIEECGDNPKDIFDLLLNIGYDEFRVINLGMNNYLDYEDVYYYSKVNPAQNVVCT